MNFFNQDLTSLHADLVSKKITATELTQATFDNLKGTDAKVDAFLNLNEAAALKQAAELDAKGIDPDNLLAGIPVAVKDNIVTKGLTTTAASKMLENFVPVYDATVVEKMQAHDMIIIGKTNLDEFAMGGSTENSAFKTTKNPWDVSRVPGGSSGGSAVAVAAGEVPVAFGSDTGGSIRQPASFNGIVGMKPTYGRVSRWGLIAFGSSLDQIGTMTRNVKDNAAALNIIAGNDVKDGTSSKREVPDFTAGLTGDIKGMKIALPKEYMGDGIDPKVRDVIKAAVKQFEDLGATVEEVSLPHSRYGVPAYYIIASSEASSNLQRFDGIRYGFRADDVKNLEDVYVRSRSEGFGDEVKRRIMLGTFSLSAGYYDAYFHKAGQVRTLIINDFNKVFENYDLIIGPTAPTPAFKLGDEISDPITMYMNDVLTIPVNLAGLPGMSIPAGFADGMPVGLQLIGKSFDESTLYKAGYAFEQATDFHQATPDLGGAH
ncbi:Asp-tRNA(Asn)/Glu-tRNA(Gln) amidotransferase subunit GatA [Lactiplantibacillus mudanjiangensis]|uniref:Glutamyl-tRNA(Gln) amidotransferase subunit A n=1 Tax=Lactiplantibacillus mudanjiangensis TaxID=1296538 RepID=A0A660E4A6_9LACO|nr:Asp-tRNA(Asn)/Glu-tRNA(Gln) amidotransferase subunit GatA [Lactiplantibacillus mudanjiangensis]VDG23103.1 Asp-tRNA(Asn)/Glu-tRNA(Gln) amidotransferase GatCAB subunit A [Lactobacillus sp.] [Lactiplantibacillus mudanjiangensis]VDG29573.1 Asp-tRNA(Asn)/Glu-tRNA(Gln) amidotransferase GatCAB subunit A [Lactobacillus sp.] [Lactiplantibacillus mudanjiangensis]VDG32686.1 Asp-tRNA(Asn)/Glu-tRNA(Gln) amidotransferase GatCAB subunit A [Lactobacillus sp.] [Lactiplantibacillus mudanjiangensis]